MENNKNIKKKTHIYCIFIILFEDKKKKNLTIYKNNFYNFQDKNDFF